MKPPLLALAALLLTTSAAAGPKKDPDALPEKIEGYEPSYNGRVKQLTRQNALLRLRDTIHFPVHSDQILLSLNKMGDEVTGYNKECLAGFRVKNPDEDDGATTYALLMPKTQTTLPPSDEKAVQDYFHGQKRTYCTITLNRPVTDAAYQFPKGKTLVIDTVRVPKGQGKVEMTFVDMSAGQAEEGDNSYQADFPWIQSIACVWPGSGSLATQTVGTFLGELPVIRQETGCAGGDLFDAWTRVANVEGAM
jgi:hypothetical protein